MMLYCNTLVDIFAKNSFHVVTDTIMAPSCILVYLFIVQTFVFNVFKKLAEVQVTTECGYFRNKKFSIVGPSYPEPWLLGPARFFLKCGKFGTSQVLKLIWS